ncbi:AI-2E family transporter [Clostridium thermarum]|uniref:AI-2E family transporter n=1 Tax=Clostridium thermarum TaxID=1716543 RepID=UPI0013D74185|nr:AI-2E family transporter [Clostridium thermarum]
MNRILKYKVLRYILILTVSLLAIFLLTTNPIIKEVLGTLFIAFVIAYSLKPVQDKLIEKGIGKKISSIIILLGLFLGIAVILVFLIPNVIRETLNIGNTFDEFEGIINNINKRIEDLSNNRYFKNVITIALSKIEKAVTGFCENAFDCIFEKSGNLLSIAVIPILVYYILSDGHKIGKNFIAFIPHRKRPVMRNLFKDINLMLSKYILSQFLLSALISIMTFFVLLALGVDFPLLLSLLNGIFNVIPYFGPLFGAVPPVLVALVDSPKTALWTAVLLNLIQQIEGDIISPKITGETVNIHPLFIILLLIAGGKVGGFVGMVMAVPVAVMVKVILEDLDYYMY